MYDMREGALLAIGDRTVGRVMLGTARWSIGESMADALAETVLEQAIEMGIDAVDTARAYTRRGEEGHSEALVARVLDRLGARSSVLVATKGGHFREGDSYRVDASPEALRADCESSLRALRTDCIDLYLLHFPDPAVPFLESVGALSQLRQHGMINHIGLCNVSTEQLDAAVTVAPIAAVQCRHSPDEPAPHGLLNSCVRHGVAFLGYSPLAGGRYTARSIAADTAPTPVRAAVKIATAHATSVETVLMAWLLSWGNHIGLITGARRLNSLTAAVDAAVLHLDELEIATLDEEFGATERAGTSVS